MRQSPSQSATQYQLRFPDGLRELVKQRAEQAGRTMNAEIILRLKEAYNAEEMNKRKMKAAEILGGSSGLL